MIGAPLLGRGRTADVYAWKEGYVVKLFHESVNRAGIEGEAHIARLMREYGLPVPAVGDLVEMQGRRGIVFERLDGMSMLQLLQRQLWRVRRHARRLAELHAELHSVRAPPALRPQREYLKDRIAAAALSIELRTRVERTLASLPDGNCICHGDFHPGNVLITDRGPAIIDWINASRGNPLADVARTTVLVVGAAQNDPQISFGAKLFARIFHPLYLRHYFRLRSEGREQYRNWLAVVSAARLSESTAGEEKWLLARIRDCAAVR